MRRKAALYCENQGSEPTIHSFLDRIVIGRRQPGDPDQCHIVIPDRMVSARHCIVSQSSDGRFLLRDVSRNGVRVDGRRIAPNVETELAPGAVIQIAGRSFTFRVEEAPVERASTVREQDSTEAAAGESPVTLLVGDIRGYTTLSQQFGPADVAGSVRTVFERLAAFIGQMKGTVKEYQGDAIVAFWEGDLNPPFQFALDACNAALRLHEEVRAMAGNPGVWRIRDFPLQMDFALASGMVSITTVGGNLAVVGDPINYAFRLEKLATDQTGFILTCNTTQLLAKKGFRFRPLGVTQVKGRAKAEPIFSLQGAL